MSNPIWILLSESAVNKECPGARLACLGPSTPHAPRPPAPCRTASPLVAAPLPAAARSPAVASLAGAANLGNRWVVPPLTRDKKHNELLVFSCSTQPHPRLCASHLCSPLPSRAAPSAGTKPSMRTIARSPPTRGSCRWTHATPSKCRSTSARCCTPHSSTPHTEPRAARAGSRAQTIAVGSPSPGPSSTQRTSCPTASPFSCAAPSACSYLT